MDTRDIIASVLLLMISMGSMAQDSASDDIRSLDGQVQQIKSDVLDIAAELGNLEERLLYPSHTQLALFLELESAGDVRLDAVHVRINENETTHHIYSFHENEALKKGGVQRLFTGNLANGQHSLMVTVLGQTAGGSDFESSGSLTFEKGVEPAVLGITVDADRIGQPDIRFGDW